MEININEIIENNEIANSRLYKMYNHILDNLKNNDSFSVDTDTIKKEHPAIYFPESKDLNIIFKNRDKSLLDSLSLPDETQGAFVLNDEEGLLTGRKGYPDSFNVVVFIDDKEMEDFVEHETYLDIEAGIPSENSRDYHLTSFCNTLTHEIEHAIEFMENSGGLTPHEVNEMNALGDFNYDIFYDIFSCMTGYGMEKYGSSYDEIDQKMLKDDLSLIEVENDIIDIVEERVETNSRKKLESSGVDLLSIYEEQSKIKKQPKTLSPTPQSLDLKLL